MGSAGVVGELRKSRWSAPNHHDAVVRRSLVPYVRSELLPLGLFGHVAMRSGITRSATSCAASSWSVGET